MCGIAGKVWLKSDRPASQDHMQAMLSVMRHRGPDGQGIFANGPACLGHLRLSIIDLATGGQPLHNEDGNITVVFNGEIYNYRDLREGLLKQGHQFRTQSDTEVIVHLYEQYGDDCVDHLQGMFAFAIWDAPKRRLFVARDRVGIKPLYYALTGDALYISSEMKGILVDKSVPKEVDTEAVRRFLAFLYLPGDSTLIRTIRKLLPGHSMVLEQGQLKIRRYWDLRYTKERWNHSFEDATIELQALLTKTVQDHMISDVPVGVLLSGGVDSSAILSHAARSTDKRVRTFTVGFEGEGVVDERPYARMSAKMFDTDHHETTIRPDDFWGFLPDYVWHMEEPVCEPPALALHAVSQLARQHVKVLLSGEGGDEAFGGYPNYPNMLRLRALENRVGPLAGVMGSVMQFVGKIVGDGRLERYGSAMGQPLSAHYFSRASCPTAAFISKAQQLFTPAFIEGSSRFTPQSDMEALLSQGNPSNMLDQMLYCDSKTWLPDDLLVKADKITMASSLELRVPLLDHKVLEFAASLPPAFKVQGMETKRILKAAFRRILPAEVLDRKKAGFPVPYGSWLRCGLKDRVRETLLSTTCQSRGYFKANKVAELLDQNEERGSYPKEVFSLLILELWHQRFLS